jgi:hypothetical protein
MQESSSLQTPSSASRAEKRLIVTAIDKGGVGKSFFCVRVCEWLDSRHPGYTAFDPDYTNSSLTRFCPRSQFLDIRHSENLDQIVDSFAATDLVLVDGVGAHQGVFLDWLDETNLLGVKHEIDLRVTLVVIVEEDKDTVHQAGEAVRRIGGDVDWIVVRNLKQGNHTNIYDHSQARQTLLASGAREITMPKLCPHLAARLQENSWTIPAAFASGRLDILDRQRLANYSRGWAGEMEKVSDLVLP